MNASSNGARNEPPAHHRFGTHTFLPALHLSRFATTMQVRTHMSAYAVRAIEVHGIIKGTLLASWRLLRCNPWSNGGVDHVPLQGQWSAPPWVPPDDWAGYLDPDDFPVMGLSDCDESPSCTHDTIDQTCAHSPVRDTHEGDVHVV